MAGRVKPHCATCGKQKPVHLHHGKLYCAGCLRAGDDDEIIVQSRIVRIRSEATRKEARRIKEEEE